MKLKNALLCMGILLSTFFLNHAFGQNITATGNVKNKSTGDPVVGASVNLQGFTTTTTTDASGNFSISVPKGGKLLITSIGYSPSTIQINKAGSVSVLMDESSKSLDEVVVVGYGTQKVTKVSGAISTVKSSDIQKLKAVRLEEALQGGASGVTVIQSGAPGAKPTLFIRGIPGLGADPVVIVDGVQQTVNDLNSISPADIESLNVLKDAATTAIYGVKGGNGVIVVTTKTGKKNQKTDISVNTSYGIQEVVRTLPVLNASEYGAMLNEGSTLNGGDVVFRDLSQLGKGTNWQKEIFKTAPIQNYSVSARGGSEKVTYFLSGSYLSQGGIVGGYDKSKFNRINFTSNLSFDLSTRLKFIVNATYLNLDSKGVSTDAFNSVVGNALNFDPTVTKYNTVPNTVGTYGFSNLITNEIQNPLTQLENTYNKLNGNKLYGKFEFQYSVLKNLKLTGRFGYTKYDANSKVFSPLVFLGPNNTDQNNTLNADGTTKPKQHNSVAADVFHNNSYTGEAFANYDFKVFKNHHFETVIGISLGKEFGNQGGSWREDVPFNSWKYADYTSATGVNTIEFDQNNNPIVHTAIKGYSFEYFNKHASGFVRLNYDYKDKYLASFTGRRDGSTKFAINKRFGNFYAGSLGWVVSKEGFFKSKMIDFLKLRGSYGVVGNDQALPNNYGSISTIQTDYLASLYGSGNAIGYTFGNTFANGATLGTYYNPDLHWEEDGQGNIGFDMNFYHNKFNISADYFYKKTKDLLFTTALSSYLGSIPSPVVNIGSTNAKGVDITLGYTDKIIQNKLGLNTSVTFTTVKGNVTSTGASGAIKGGGFFNGQSQATTIFAPGYAPGVYYGYKTDGLFQTMAQIKASPVQGSITTRSNGQKDTTYSASPGDIKYVDINGDGIINSDDQKVIGSPFPKFTIGWNVNLTYKNIDLSVFTYASSGNDVVRAFERNANFTNKYAQVLNRWTGPNSTNDAKNPRYVFADPNNNARFSDRYVEDGSFIKIKNILLGYTFNGTKVKRIFKGLRVYGQVKNAFTFTKYNGFDPEVAATGLLDTGVDRGVYPQARTYYFGIDIKL
jgi:TonB-dependent starch-binding outer membrane protein SusC